METILILIIIGVISTVFGKGKGKGKVGERPAKDKPFSVNSFDEFRTLFQNQLTNQVPEKLKPTQHVQMDLQPAKMKNLDEKYLQMNRDAQISSPKPKQQIRARAKDSDKIVVETNPYVSVRPDAKVLINGIIWAEILGEPRSKKPYSSR
jgi:hypothetical protein